MLKFLNDTELAIFLWRHCAATFEDRTLVLMRHQLTVERVEQIANHEKSWRLCEGDLATCFEELPEEKLTGIREAFKGKSIVVIRERENGWLDELLGLNIEVESQDSTQESSSLKEFAEFLDMIACIISAVIDQQDIWAVTRLWSKLQPEVLPPLRRKASEGGLNIVQSFFSYVMEANIQENSGSDPILAQHFQILKLFEKAVDQIHEDLISEQDIKKALECSVKTAADFLLMKYPCNSKIKQAQRFAQKQVAELISNFKDTNTIYSNSGQKTPSFITIRERLCRALVDRIAVLDFVIQATDGMTPIFRTPQVVRMVQESVDTDKESVETTPTAAPAEKIRVATFVNNGTPTPIRPANSALFDTDCFEPVNGTLEELLEDDKENLDPNVEAAQPHQLTPKRKSSTKSEKPALRRKSSGVSTSVAPKKKSKAVEAHQPSIASFFRRSQ